MQLEMSKKILLAEKEEEWRQKNRFVWLKSVDENTIFFHNFAKGKARRWKIQSRKWHSLMGAQFLLKSVQQEMLSLGSVKNRTAKNSTSKNISLANEHFGYLG